MKQFYTQLLIIFLLVTSTYAQENDNSLFLRTNTIVPIVSYTDIGNTGTQQFSDHYYIIQFFSIPTEDMKIAFQQSGIQLIEYIPNNAWIAKIAVGTDLSSPFIKTVYEVPSSIKIAPSLQEYMSTTDTDDVSTLTVRTYLWHKADHLPFIDQLTQDHPSVQALNLGRFIETTLPPSLLLSLAQYNQVKTIESTPITPELDDLSSRSLARLTTPSALTNNASLGYWGEDMAIAIGDDGLVDHPDLQGRIFAMTDLDTGTHSDMTSGLAAGGGNINPLATGMAPKANVYLFSYTTEEHIWEAPANYTNYDIAVTSSSYSEGCGGLYTQDARDLDQQIVDNPMLLHHFSAGNKGLQSCNTLFNNLQMDDGGYYGNITGGKKTGKNIITVGNVEFNDTLYLTSSRGPTNDLRIKPDICAQGQGTFSIEGKESYQAGSGTSAATPNLSGSSLLLYESFRKLHDGEDPSSGLIKPTLLNSAQDLGSAGPDYKYGWGRIHIPNALEIIENNQYFEGQISHGESMHHPIQIPPHTDQVKIMLYWIDPPSSPFASKALLNDLDLSVTTPYNQTKLPLVLSTYIHPDSLSRPALPGYDRVNNVEQVVIDNPTAANYQININGFLVPQANQKYFVVYSFFQDTIAITAPQNNESISPNQDYTIRWDALADDAPFTIEYSIDEEQTWQTIADNIPSHLRHYTWSIPANTPPGVAIRVSKQNSNIQTTNTFSIVAVPQFDVQYINSTTAKIEWQNIPNATSYAIYQLGEHHMERIQTTTINEYFFPINEEESNWFTVSANYQQQEGIRAIAKKYQHTPCNSSLTIDLQFDAFPEQTSWELKNQNGDIVSSGGPYSNMEPHSFLSINKCLPAGCYTLVIKDSAGDGMCCSNGPGYFKIYGESGQLIVTGGNFNASKNLYICIEPVATELSLGFTDIQQPSCHNASDGHLTAIAYGGVSNNYTYHWNTGATTPTITNITAGTYSVTISDGQQQITSNFILNNPSPMSINFTTVDISCNQETGYISPQVQGGVPPYNYIWNTGQKTPVLATTTTDVYTLTVTDANGCSISNSSAIQVFDDIVINTVSGDETCLNQNNGFAQVTYIPGASYLWSNGETSNTISNLSAGTYTVTVTNVTGCTGIASAEVLPPPSIQLTTNVSNPLCDNDENGHIAVLASGGSPPYAFDWSTGATTSIIYQLSEGLYTLTVTDANGCSNMTAIQLSTPQPIQINTIASNPLCANENNGYIAPLVSGGTTPYSFEWSTGTTSAIIDELEGGTYSLTVTDINGCSSSSTVNLSSPLPIDIDIMANDPLCVNDANGAISSLPTGGTGVFDFEWSTGETTPSINQLEEGTYTLTVTDNSGCFETISTQLVAPDEITIHFVSSPPTNSIGATLQAYPSGGTAPYQYNWSNGSTDQTLLNIEPGTYTLTVTDQNGCTTQAQTTITDETNSSDEYCEITGNSTTQEWIKAIIFNGQSNFSGNDDGYGDYTNVVFNAARGTFYNFNGIPGFNNHAYSESWKVWIDYNQDFDFDDPGEVIIQEIGVLSNLNETIFIPTDAPLGNTRMRIAMKYGSPANACGAFAYGEAEDYTINIVDDIEAVSINPHNTHDTHKAYIDQSHILNQISIYPNPAKDYFTIQGQWQHIRIIDTKGVVVQTNTNEAQATTIEIPIRTILPGIYIVEIKNGELTTHQQIIIL